MTSSDLILIVGSGLAGYMLAQELRKLDKNLPLAMVTSCDGRYYYKPSLSNALIKEQVPASFAMVEPAKMAERLNLVLHTQQQVLNIDPIQRQVHTATQCISYSKLVLASGADVVTAPLTGDTSAVYSVNNLQNYETLRDALAGRQRVAILGAGLVGCEFANTLAMAGYSVDIIAPTVYPLQALLPQALGTALENSLAAKEVRWHWQQFVGEIEKITAGYQLKLNNGSHLVTDIILSTIGLRPNINLAQAAGLKVNRGICVDRQLQTSSEHIYALGDCAEVAGLVLQFVAPILQGARALAKTLAGQVTPVEYPVMPIILKTPACPIVVVPPINCPGEWQITGQGINLKAIFFDDHHCQRGFALTGAATAEKSQLSKINPTLLG